MSLKHIAQVMCMQRVDTHRGVLIEGCIHLVLSILAYCRFRMRSTHRRHLHAAPLEWVPNQDSGQQRGSFTSLEVSHSKYQFYVRGQLLTDGDDGLRVFAEVPKRQAEPHGQLHATIQIAGRHNPRCPILFPFYSLNVWY